MVNLNAAVYGNRCLRSESVVFDIVESLSEQSHPSQTFLNVASSGLFVLNHSEGLKLASIPNAAQQKKQSKR
jgi:hypothetical protein